MIKWKDLHKWLFLLMLLTACLPYLGYGVSLVQNGYVLVGSYSQSMNEIVIYTGVFGRYFVYIKDILCALLLGSMICKKDYQNARFLAHFILLVMCGIIVLTLNGRTNAIYIITGIRALLFVATTIAFCLRYNDDLVSLDWLSKIKFMLSFTMILQIIVVVLQIQASKSWTRFGSGAYRFCGLFAGSGNLGCYSIALALFFLALYKKFKIIRPYQVVSALLCLLFLSIASGTRTTMILNALCLLYILVDVIMERRFGYKSIILFFLILIGIVGTPMLNWFVQWTNRGELMLSGGGRIELFMNMVNTSNIFTFVFGRGIGVGTNAAVTMGMGKAELADSTINLIYIQYGMLGLFGFLAIVFSLCKSLLKKASHSIFVNVLFILNVIIMLLVGNLFEHIAMAIILVVTYFCLISEGSEDVEKISE